MTDIVPCPFCGSVNIYDRTDGWGNAFYKCMDCFAQGPTRKVTLKNPWADAELWNTRYKKPVFVPTAEMVKDLRESTGAGMVDAKKGFAISQWRQKSCYRMATSQGNRKSVGAMKKDVQTLEDLLMQKVFETQNRSIKEVSVMLDVLCDETSSMEEKRSARRQIELAYYRAWYTCRNMVDPVSGGKS